MLRENVIQHLIDTVADYEMPLLVQPHPCKDHHIS